MTRHPPPLYPDATVAAVRCEWAKLVRAWDPLESDWIYVPSELIELRVRELLRGLTHPRTDA